MFPSWLHCSIDVGDDDADVDDNSSCQDTVAYIHHDVLEQSVSNKAISRIFIIIQSFCFCAGIFSHITDLDWHIHSEGVLQLKFVLLQNSG